MAPHRSRAEPRRDSRLVGGARGGREDRGADRTGSRLRHRYPREHGAGVGASRTVPPGRAAAPRRGIGQRSARAWRGRARAVVARGPHRGRSRRDLFPASRTSRSTRRRVGPKPSTARRSPSPRRASISPWPTSPRANTLPSTAAFTGCWPPARGSCFPGCATSRPPRPRSAGAPAATPWMPSFAATPGRPSAGVVPRSPPPAQLPVVPADTRREPS